jgi:hypothetical protein
MTVITVTKLDDRRIWVWFPAAARGFSHVHKDHILSLVPQQKKLVSYLLTHKAANCAATQELPSILWNPKVQYRVHKSPPLVPIWNHNNPIYTIPSYLSTIHFNLVNPPTSSSSQWSLYFWLSTNVLYAFFFSIHAICPAHLIPLALIILIILGEGHKLWSSSLCSFLQPPVTLALFGQSILLNALFSHTLSLCSSLNVRDQARNTIIVVIHTNLTRFRSSSYRVLNLWNEILFGVYLWTYIRMFYDLKLS